jgi:hypothetical protein
MHKTQFFSVLIQNSEKFFGAREKYFYHIVCLWWMAGMLYYCVYSIYWTMREEQLLNERGRKREIHPQISRFTLVSMNRVWCRNWDSQFECDVDQVVNLCESIFMAKSRLGDSKVYWICIMKLKVKHLLNRTSKD